jgi:succinate-semialdehyde dehydrogenase/glutarate-semialdehyde dehydrogenase
VPFDGVKQSCYGRDDSHYGIEEYVLVKYTLMAGLA